jgi:hypothetical protein
LLSVSTGKHRKKERGNPMTKFIFAAVAVVTLLTGTALQTVANATAFHESTAGVQGGASG